MNYLKITKYIYLAFGVVLAILGFLDWKEKSQNWYVFLFMSAVCIFMYFFRNNFEKKFKNNNNNNPK